MLTMILSERGARVVSAASVAAGLTALDAERPDVLVSDVGMPGDDGYTLVREVRRREAGGPRLPAIALTAFARPQDRAVALAAGFDEHLAKPLKAEALLHAIARLVQSGRGT
jgi:CheY-like chemotaxis protein